MRLQLVLIFLLFFKAQAQNTFYVSTTGSNSNSGITETDAFSTIQYAIGAAASADTIILLPGVYNQTLSIDKSLTIGSKMLIDPMNEAYYVDNTILDGMDLGILIRNNINQANQLNLVGLTVQNCPGEVMEINSVAHSVINKVKFINNGHYGAQLINSIGNITIQNCFFSGNLFATLIVLNPGYSTYVGFPIINACEFKDNGNPALTEKNIIYSFNRAKITNNLIYNNSGIMINGGCNGPLDSLIVEHNTIVANQGYGMVIDHCGGGVRGFVNNNIIENNTLGCLRYVSNGSGYSIIKVRNNKLNPNPYFTQNPLQYNVTWTNNDTISGFTFNYPVSSSSDLQLPNFSNSIGSGYNLIQTVSATDFLGNPRPQPVGSTPDRGAIENFLSTPANAAPVIDQVSDLTINEDQFSTINLSGIADGDYYAVQTISITSTSDNTGLIPMPTVNYVPSSTTGSISFTPVLNQTGTAVITVRVQDDGGLLNGGVDTTQIEFTVTVLPVNDAPNAIDNADNTNEDISVSLNIVSNDTDIDSSIDPSSVDLNTVLAGIQNSFTNSFGNWSVNSVGVLTYTPALNFNGIATLDYTVQDIEGATSAPASITITVIPVNDAPLIGDDYTVTTEEVSVTFYIVANDVDPENGIDASSVDLNPVLSGVQNTYSTAQGSWSVNALGELTFNPAIDFYGLASLEYRIADVNGAYSLNGLVEVDVLPVNDNPTNLLLSNLSLNENVSSISIGTFSTQDPDAPVTYTYQLVPGIGDDHNSLFSISSDQLMNISAFDYETQNSFNIRVRSTDEGGLFVENTFTITVLNVNDIQITDNTQNTYCNGTNASGEINVNVTESNGSLSYAWTGPNGFSSSSQNLTNLESGNYFLTVTDDFHSQTATISVGTTPIYDGLTICYVSSDTVNALTNRVYFNNPGMYNIDKYQVLRESTVAGVYDLIGQVNAADTSYLDVISNNSSVSYKYKVRSVDSCGNFSAESAFHRTILLQANLGINNTVNLSWNPYEGISYSSYSIYRKENNGSFQLLITLPSSNTTFNDGTANVGLNSYVYYVAIPLSACDFTKVGAEIRSNNRTLDDLFVNNLENEGSEIELYPNPTTGKLSVKLSDLQLFEQLNVFDPQGKLVLTSTQPEISLADLENGTYLVKVLLDNQEVITKLVVKQ